MTDTPAVEFFGVTKDYEVGRSGFKLRALDNLTLQVPRGQVFGLLGPNGSGKSTAIRLILGLMTPTTGHIRVCGEAAGTRAARAEIGYLPDAPDFYRYLSGRELLRFHGQLCELNGARLERRIADLLALVRMEFAADRRVGSYSKGMLQRIGLAQALVHDPTLLILDEPTAGVDPEGAAEMAQLILTLKAEGKTILVTSHLLDQMEEICDRVAILDRGELLRESATAELVGRALYPTEQRSEAGGMSCVTTDLRANQKTTQSLGEVFLSTIRSHRERARAVATTAGTVAEVNRG